MASCHLDDDDSGIASATGHGRGGASDGEVRGPKQGGRGGDPS